MRAPSVGELMRVLFFAAAFGWRIERWGNGDALSGWLAVVFGVVALALAYRIWARARPSRYGS
jgi:hypothetical protein